jgi:hypothetical protein
MSLARSSFPLFLAMVAGCRTVPPRSAFVDVPIREASSLGVRELPGMRDGDEHLGISLEWDGADLLLDLGWWRNMTQTEIAGLTRRSTPDQSTPIISIGPSELNVRAWNANGMQPLDCERKHMAACGNLGAFHDWTRYRISMPTSPVCVEITWGEQKHYWRIRP